MLNYIKFCLQLRAKYKKIGENVNKKTLKPPIFLKNMEPSLFLDKINTTSNY